MIGFINKRLIAGSQMPPGLRCDSQELQTGHAKMIAMITGILGSILVVIGAVMTVSSPEVLFDAPAVILVVAMALFATFGASTKLSRSSLIRHFGQSAVRAGWIGFLVGIILIFSMADPSAPDLIEYLLRASAVALLTLLYGYGLDYLARIISPRA
jgi:drug/metabolite transporter (DMT)-like permease